MSDEDYHKLWNKINKACRQIDENLPTINSNYSEFPMFIFDRLDKTIISQILLDHVKKDKDLAGYLARVIYYVNPIDTFEYFTVAMSFIDLFEFRVFD